MSYIKGVIFVRSGFCSGLQKRERGERESVESIWAKGIMSGEDCVRRGFCPDAK